jgi:hypothetical protein
MVAGNYYGAGYGQNQRNNYGRIQDNLELELESIAKF